MSSQNDEDAILADLIARVRFNEPGRFVEIGTGPEATECNTRALHDRGWTGCWIDRQGVPPVHRAHVTTLNVNGVLRELGCPTWFEVLSIDVDGQDLWLWKALYARPGIVVIEYNASLGHADSLSIPRDDDYVWDGRTWGFGASLLALTRLGHHKGYVLAHANGVNAFFVRLDLWARACYRPLEAGFLPAPDGAFVLAP